MYFYFNNYTITKNTSSNAVSKMFAKLLVLLHLHVCSCILVHIFNSNNSINSTMILFNSNNSNNSTNRAIENFLKLTSIWLLNTVFP